MAGETEDTLSAEEALMEQSGNFLFGEEPTETPVEEPVTESVEEPDEEYEAGQEPQVEGDDELVEVEYNGQIIEAPPEIAEVLQKAESMDSDYTQKTQALSAERKQFETTVAELQQQKQQYEFAASIQDDLTQAYMYEQQIEQAQNLLTQQASSLTAPEFQQVQAGIADLKHKRDSLVQSLTTKQQEFQQSQEQAHAELLNKGTETLRSMIPGWNEQHQAEVRQYALDSGFTEAEIAGVVDPRQVNTLWKAAQYDKLKSGAKPAVAKLAQVKPKSRNPMSKETGGKLNLRKKLKSSKHSAADKAAMIGESISII